jgi:hypothetical protein
MYYSPMTDAKQNPARSSGVLVCHEPDQSGTSFCRSPVLGIVDVGHLRSRRGPDYSAAELTAQGLSDTKAMWEKAGRLPNAKMLAQVRAR